MALKKAPGAGVNPVPDNGTDCGEPGALSVTAILADLAPLAMGLNVTLMEHELLPDSVLPQLLVSMKSPGLVPVTAMDVIESDVPPLFVSITDLIGLEVPTA